MGQIKVDSKVYEMEGVETTGIGSFVKYLDLGDKLITSYTLSVSAPNIKLPDKYTYLRIQSDWPIIVHIIGKGEFKTDFLEMSLTESDYIQLKYIDPGQSDNITIDFIGIRE